MIEPAPRAQTPRAVLYLRQSTYREESISLELQETAAREYAQRSGYQVVAIEEDAGISGRTWKRPAVLRVMGMIERGEADVLIVWKWSRLSRARLDWAVAVDKVETAGGRIESATEPLDTSNATGRLARGMMAEFAAFESERMGDVWKESHRRRIRNGVPATGGPRFGYVRVDKMTYEVDPATADVLLATYQHYVRDEWGWTRLTRWLNESGHTTTTGGPWAPDKIRGVLDAGFGAGVLATGYRTGKLTYHPGIQPRIIDETLWGAYLARRARAPRPPAAVEPKSMLSGLLCCADCGANMRAAQRKPGVPGYGCGHYLKTRTGRYVTCTRHSVEACVRAWVDKLASDVEGLARAKAAMQQFKVTSINDTAAVDKRISKFNDQLGTLTIRYNSDKISDAAYGAAAGQLEREIAALSLRQTEVRASSREEIDVRELAMKLSTYWDRMTNLELRTTLSELISDVLVIPPVEYKRGVGTITFRVVPKWTTR